MLMLRCLLSCWGKSNGLRCRVANRDGTECLADGLVFAEFAVDLEFFCGELCEHLLVAAAVGFGDQGAEFALAAFEVAMREGVESIFDLLGHGLHVDDAAVVGVFEGAGEEDAALLVGGGVEGVGRGGGVGESFEERGGGEALVPLGMIGELVGGEGAGRVVLRGGRGRGGGRARSRWRGRGCGRGRFRRAGRRLA